MRRGDRCRQAAKGFVADLHKVIGRGHYARKQLFSRDRLVAWSHRRRFDTAVAIAREFAGRRVLDYGCGDGTFLALAMMTDRAPALGVGAELSLESTRECRLRYRDEPSLEFVQVSDLDGAGHAGRYDAVFCMEVLEHVVDWDPELDRMSRLLAPGGKLIISVPVETGVPVLVKQTVRQIAGWRKIGHYPGTTSIRLVGARLDRVCRAATASRASGLRRRRRSLSRSQRVQLEGAARSTEPAVRSRARPRQPFFAARSAVCHAGVVHLQSGPAMRALRVGIVCDYLEERWPSMDLIGDMLVQTLPAVSVGKVEAVQLRPQMNRRLSRLPLIGHSTRMQLADRLTARLWDYPRLARTPGARFRCVPCRRSQLCARDAGAPGRTDRCDMPRPRCHDRGAASGIGECCGGAAGQVGSGWHLARGACRLQQRSDQVRSAGKRARRARAHERQLFRRSSELYARCERHMQRQPTCYTSAAPFHANGSICCFGCLRERASRCRILRLIRAGGAFTPEQQDLARDLGVLEHIVQMPTLEREQLADVYRHASLVLLPSDREGFGLPVIEAMACGTPVVASGIPALREIGGDAATYCAPGDVTAWVDAIAALLREKEGDTKEWKARRDACVRRAARFDWKTYAGEMSALYLQVAQS